jgi:DNA repair protein RecN (Recombination protein N)
MLRELRINNFAIIEDLSLDLGPGLNVLTGETGAGKSILVGALGLALGDRAQTEMIRTGSNEASVEAYFDITGHPVLKEMGIDSSEGIIIRRGVARAGKSRAYINNTMMTLQDLGRLGRTLVDLHGQHEHQSLLKAENQMRLLDRFGGLDADREHVAALYEEVRGLHLRLEGLKRGARDRGQRLDLLRYQINEIDEAAITESEDRELMKERSILANLSRLNELLESSYGLIYDSEGSALEKLSSARAWLDEMARVDTDMSAVLEVLDQALPLLEEVSISLRDFRDKYQMDPKKLAEVEERLRLIEGLKRKYGDTLWAVLRYREESVEEASGLENSYETLGTLEEDLKEGQESLLKACAGLSGKRKDTSRRLEASIKGALKELALEKSGFRIDITESVASSSGTDSVEFLFSANSGEALKPLNKVASGGELSRIMLAAKSVLRLTDGIPVLIFDEVDAGIGGKTAHNVARRLKALSRDTQVLCISHLPQIASEADRHILIDKTTREDRVHVGVRRLTGREREEEVARMLGGRITETSLKHAKEIIRKSRP